MRVGERIADFCDTSSIFGPRVMPRALSATAPLGGGSFASSAVISTTLSARAGDAMVKHNATQITNGPNRRQRIPPSLKKQLSFSTATALIK
jgi:hypothetical protein